MDQVLQRKMALFEVIFDWIGKPKPYSASSGTDHMIQNIERLAAISPHLLADIGMNRVSGPDAEGTEYWSNGSLIVRVSYEGGTQTVAVTCQLSGQED